MHLSPIDQFYQSRFSILKLGTSDFLQNHAFLGPLLLVGVVSAVENYLRQMLSHIIKICPCSKRTSAEQAVNFGAIVWHGSSDFERGAFEHYSFTDVSNIDKAFKNFVGFDLKKVSLSSVLLEYDKICELRHAVVHASAIVPGRNAVKLHIESSQRPLRVNINYPELQEAALICSNLVTGLNLALFAEMVRRWAVEWPKLTPWSVDNAHNTFSTLWGIFYSNLDKNNNQIPNQLEMQTCRLAVEEEYDIIYLEESKTG
jgi:hypothetical protein